MAKVVGAFGRRGTVTVGSADAGWRNQIRKNILRSAPLLLCQLGDELPLRRGQLNIVRVDATFSVSDCFRFAKFTTDGVGEAKQLLTRARLAG